MFGIAALVEDCWCHQASCRYPRSPRRRHRLTSGQSRSRRFCRGLWSGLSSTRHYSSRVHRSTSAISSRSDRLARRRLPSLQCYIPYAPRWQTTILSMSFLLISSRRSTRSGMRQNHTHRTTYAGQVSAWVAVIQASIIQGSAIDMARLLRRHRGWPASDSRPEPDLQSRGRRIYIWLCRALIQTRAKKRLIIYKRGLLTTT